MWHKTREYDFAFTIPQDYKGRIHRVNEIFKRSHEYQRWHSDPMEQEGAILNAKGYGKSMCFTEANETEKRGKVIWIWSQRHLQGQYPFEAWKGQQSLCCSGKAVESWAQPGCTAICQEIEHWPVDECMIAVTGQERMSLSFFSCHTVFLLWR